MANASKGRCVMRVEVYYAITGKHKGMFSVRALSGPDAGKVVDHVSNIAICAPQFVVQPAGHRRVLNEKRKNVHAFVRGFVQEVRDGQTPADLRRVHYNPYLADHFFLHREGAMGARVDSAAFAFLSKRDGKAVIEVLDPKENGRAAQ